MLAAYIAFAFKSVLKKRFDLDCTLAKLDGILCSREQP